MFVKRAVMAHKGFELTWAQFAENHMKFIIFKDLVAKQKKLWLSRLTLP